MIYAKHDKKNKCAYLKEANEYIGTLYGVPSAEVKEVGRHQRVTFYNDNDLPVMTIFCEYSKLK